MRTYLTVIVFFTLFLTVVGGAFAQTATFTKQTIDANNAGDGKAVADIDMDGKADGMIAGNSLVWYSGANFAKYTVRANVLFQEFTTNMAAGDIDGDGDPDMVAPDGSGTGNVVWFENPKLSPPAGRTADPKVTANWVYHTVGTHGSFAHSVEVGDLNGDGKMDIVTSGNGSGHAWIFQGKDSFQDINIGNTNGSTGGAQVHDINKDGKMDIVTSTGWLQNNGNGTAFTTRNVSGFHGEEVGAGDLNGDGRPDLIGSVNAHERGQVTIFFAPADPTAATWTSKVLDGNMCSHRPTAADFNNDGKLDVLLGCELKETSVYMNTGGGNFQKTQIDTASGHNAAVGDFNGDGKLDFFGSDYIGNPPVKVYLNTMAGGTPPTPTLPPGGGTVTWDKWKYINADTSRNSKNAWGLGMGDIDGDGDGDIVAGAYFYRNPGGNMEGAWTRGGGLADANLVVDLDGDATKDVIDLGGGVKWLEWEGSGLVQRAAGSGAGGAQGSVAADFVAGGMKEIAYTSGSGLMLAVINGASISITKLGDSTDEGVGAADFDADGKIDIVGSDGNNSVWWQNNGTTSNWTRRTVGPADHGDSGGGYTDKSAAADIDGDGKPDALLSEEIFTDANNANTYWYKNPGGAAANWTRKIIATQNSTNSMSVADMDRDGDQDVITGEHFGDLETVIWENVNSGASWVKHLVGTGHESHGGSKTFDLDNDGDLDIVSIAYDSFEDLHIWRNDNTTGGGGVTPTTGGTCAKKINGDANCNGTIKIDDFAIWRSEFLGTLTTKTADFDTSGAVTIADFARWRTTFLAGG